MEDILASIKRVIAEEKEFRDGETPEGDADEAEILELDESMAEVPAIEPVAVASLMAEEVAENTRASLEQLGEVAKADPQAAAANPFEDMVREMVRPMLKQWLDERLPGIVDEHVRAEISRITGRKL